MEAGGVNKYVDLVLPAVCGVDGGGGEFGDGGGHQSGGGAALCRIEGVGKDDALAADPVGRCQSLP
ncbi:hypothetical protein GON09_005293 [Rhodococcus sp. B50]|nr:hypothetical protein [Rhodococcus sp. B50]